MKTSQIALRLYFVFSLLAITGTILHNDILMLLTKPAVIPTILFYYLSVKTQPADFYIILIFLLNFAGDTIVLLEIQDETKIIMIPFFLSYIFLLRFAIMDVRKMPFYKLGLLLAVAIFGFLMYTMYSLIQLFIDTNQELVIPVIIYGAVLGSLASIAGYSYYAANTTSTFYLAIAALMSVVSDVFYIVFSLILHYPGFNYFEFSVQMFSYFFIIKYCILRSENNYRH